VRRPSQTAVGEVLLFAFRPASSRTSPELTGLVAGRLAGRQVQACAAMAGATSLARSRGARFALVWRSSRVDRSAGAPACPHTVNPAHPASLAAADLRARGAYPCHRSSGCLPWSIPVVGPVGRGLCGRLAPLGGAVRFARSIDRRIRAFGRQSDANHIVTHRGSAASTPAGPRPGSSGGPWWQSGTKYSGVSPSAQRIGLAVKGPNLPRHRHQRCAI
jgi:hypothetical protein